MKQNEIALTALGRGDKRRAVTQPCPAFDLRSKPAWIGQHLPVDQHLGRHRQPREQARLIERSKRLRCRPRQRTAELPPARAQHRRQQVVAAAFQPRSGKAHEHTAALDPKIKLVPQILGQRADIGQHQHRDVPLDQPLDGGQQIGLLGLGQLGKRGQRPLQVVQRCQQRLCQFARGPRQQADPMPLRARVEQMHRPGRPLTCDLDPCHLVAQFQR